MTEEEAMRAALKYAINTQKKDGHWDGPIPPTLFQTGLVALSISSDKDEAYERTIKYLESHPPFERVGKNKYTEKYLLHYEWIFHESARALAMGDDKKCAELSAEVKKVMKGKREEKIKRKFLSIAALFVIKNYLSWDDLPADVVEQIKSFAVSKEKLKTKAWVYLTYAAIAARYFYDNKQYAKSLELAREILRYRNGNGSWNEYPFLTAFITSVFNSMDVQPTKTQEYLKAGQFESGGFAPIKARIWDTAYALDVLNGMKGVSRYAGKARWFLIKNRLPDGTWGWDVGGSTDFDTLSMCVKNLPFRSVKQKTSVILKNQNDNGGWGTWDKGDRGSVDVTAHCVNALGREYPLETQKALDYLVESNESGAWYPYWYSNVYYGISQCLEAFNANGLRDFPECAGFIEKTQNRDGGWGELPGMQSSAVGTSHAALSLARLGESEKAGEGNEWLAANQKQNGSWERSSFCVGPYPIRHSDMGVTHFSALKCLGHSL